MGFLSWLKGEKRVHGLCVPRAFFNATAWAIATRKPVYIADFLGHWQAMGDHKGELVYLSGDGWEVWPGEKEGDKPLVKLWSLKDAMEHFSIHNPWAAPVDGKVPNIGQSAYGKASKSCGPVTVHHDPDVWSIDFKKETL